MSNFIFSIGGTGAKATESFIHLCSTGVVEGKYKIVFIDQDDENGNLNRTLQTLENYQKIKKGDLGHLFPMFKADIEVVKASKDEESSARVAKITSKDTLKSLFDNNGLLKDDHRDLFQLLFSKEEISTDLKIGFRGVPKMGVACIAANIDIDLMNDWDKLIGENSVLASEITHNQEVNVMVFGSIFGGMGASGLPTISKILKSLYGSYPNFRLGTVMMLPYFGFNNPGGETNKQFVAHSNEFLMNTAYSIDYYQKNGYADVFHSIYLIGDQNLYSIQKFSPGGNEQANESIYSEFLAATAAHDFFMINKEKKGAFYYSERELDENRVMESLPNYTEIYAPLRNATLFMMFYSKHYNREINRLISENKNFDFDIAWTIEFFKKQNYPLTMNADFFKNLTEYSRSYVKWLTQITEGNGIEYFDLKVVNQESVHFGKIEKGANKTKLSIKDHEYNMNHITIKKNQILNSERSPLGIFLTAMYQAAVDCYR